MKYPYFSSDSIHQTSQEMLQQVEAHKRRHIPPFTPQASALLILDMQDYFLEPNSHAFVPSGPVIIPNINALIEAFSGHNLPILFTRQLNTPEDAGVLKTWWHDMITADNPLSTITNLFDLSKGAVINKTQYDAFYHTGLESILRNYGVRQVVICGVMTHLCCETTARSAFVHGFEVFFTIDGTASYNQEFHQATLLNLSHGFATPILTREILASFM
jgi:bifunctional isochorismate lyase/aryl carrier protein